MAEDRKYDRARNSCSTASTGALTIGDVISGSQSIKAKMATGDKSKFYFVKGSQWLTFEGTFTGPDQLARTRLIDGSSGVATNVDFAVGQGELAIDVPAEELDALNLIEISLASAATCDIGARYGKYIALTGTTGPITSFGAVANKERVVKHSGESITHHATSLILIGGVNWVTTSGDISLFKSDASGNWLEHRRRYADGRIVSSGLLDISAAPAGQIKFPATQNSSADANTLDDYEEGTWTPVLTFATPGNLSVAYTVQVGSYIKIGKSVTVTFNILTSAFTHTTASGDLNMTGLPFTCQNVANERWRGAMQFNGITKANYTNFTCGPDANTTTLLFIASGSAQNIATVTAADMPSGGAPILQGSVTYMAAN